VWPVAGMVPLAADAGARIVLINAEPTAMDRSADVRVGGAIEAVLPQLVARVVAR